MARQPGQERENDGLRAVWPVLTSWRDWTVGTPFYICFCLPTYKQSRIPSFPNLSFLLPSLTHLLPSLLDTGLA
jgi:hypothetical protein